MNKREVLIVNLGSPESPSRDHVAAFLKEFLMDKFVLRMPYLLRYFLVNHIIVPKRVEYSAANYSKIWSDECGSPIIYNTKELVKKLENEILEGESNFSGVSYAMRYGKCSISKKINDLAAKGVTELLVVPMYPQCEGSTYESSIVEVKRVAAKANIKVDFMPPFYKDSGYIAALANSVYKIIGSSNNSNNEITTSNSNNINSYNNNANTSCDTTTNNNTTNTNNIIAGNSHINILSNNELDKLLISFHGVPIKYLPCGAKCAHSCKDPLQIDHVERVECSFCYKKECYTTAHLLAEALHLQRGEYEILFQSRLGGGEWIGPYLSKWVENLSGDKNGTKRVAIIAPSFTADCLETLFEIDMEIRELFMASGGEEFYYIPALNYNKDWVEALAANCLNS